MCVRVCVWGCVSYPGPAAAAAAGRGGRGGGEGGAPSTGRLLLLQPPVREGVQVKAVRTEGTRAATLVEVTTRLTPAGGGGGAGGG